MSAPFQPIDIAERFAQFGEHWRPKTVASLNGQDLKLVKTQGVFPWHTHPAADELFLCWKGVFTVEFRDRRVDLQPGQMVVVPRGVEHRTLSEAEAEVLIFEQAGVVNTGDAPPSEFTAPATPL